MNPCCALIDTSQCNTGYTASAGRLLARILGGVTFLMTIQKAFAFFFPSGLRKLLPGSKDIIHIISKREPCMTVGNSVCDTNPIYGDTKSPDGQLSFVSVMHHSDS